MVDWQQKIKIKHWLKCPTKIWMIQNLIFVNISDSKSHICNSFFLFQKYNFGPQLYNFETEKCPLMACCLGLAKCLTIFYFNRNFWKFSYFSVFGYFPQVLKHWHFPGNLDFKGKIMAKFFIRCRILSIWNNMAIK